MPRELGFPDHTGPNPSSHLAGMLWHGHIWPRPEGNGGLMTAQAGGTHPPRCICWHLASGTAKESSGPGLPRAGTHCAAQGAWDRGLVGISLCPMLCTTEAGGCGSSGHHTPCWKTCLARTPARPQPSARASALAGARRACSHSLAVPQAAPAFALGLAAVLRQHVTAWLKCFHFCYEPCSSPSASSGTWLLL